VSVLPSVLVIESSAEAAAERKAGSRTIDNQRYDVTSGCNLGLVLLWIGLTKLKPIHKIYFIF